MAVLQSDQRAAPRAKRARAALVPAVLSPLLPNATPAYAAAGDANGCASAPPSTGRATRGACTALCRVTTAAEWQARHVAVRNVNATNSLPLRRLRAVQLFFYPGISE